MGMMMSCICSHSPACVSAWIPRVDRARLIERPALIRTRRISGRRSWISTLCPRSVRPSASRGPLRPAPIRLILCDDCAIQEVNGSTLFCEKCPRLPQFREKLLVQSQFEVRRAGAAACAHAHADDTLDQLNVAKPPAHHKLIKLGEPLTHIDPVAVARLVSVE